MKLKYTLAFLFAFFGLHFHASAQVEKGDWQFGISAGPNYAIYSPSIQGYFFGATYLFEYKQKKLIGFQGSLSASYQIHKILQVHGALGISRLNSHTEVDGFTKSDTLSKNEIFDHQYLMLEIPLFLRLYLSQKRFSPFLEFGIAYYIPIINNSKYRSWENGALIASNQIEMNGIAKMLGIGLAIGNQNAFELTISPYESNKQQIEFWKLTYTRFFLTKKHVQKN